MTEQRGKVGESQSISRAVAVLRFVADHPGASLGEIAKATGMPRSTVQRLVGSLNGEGLVTRSFGQQGVYLGMELARLGAKVALDARVLFRPAMEELHARIGENIDLTVLEQGRVVVIEQFASNEDIQVISYVGRQHPVHCTANGKAHLGQLSRIEAMELLGNDLPAYTKHTITDPKALMAQVEAFRQIGLYVDREEFGVDICAMATTLPDVGDRKLAISLAMPASRFQRREEEVKAALLDFRRTIQGSFGDSI
ncbi:IclR family transcriptional regulator [Neotabrizicola shimadae]|uniref:IclR family transcriptional regulator n=1 Tax=Neotabrizicola shimadae TaxID=2807096 RepID=A0A8G0ZT65_9RHOB|nr:IclR family transcriptional regulator [Neotabrizicola shimadae]QYZ69587.1 IclR family transcriptional regulator [Neotabrizicola shimadae]